MIMKKSWNEAKNETIVETWYEDLKPEEKFRINELKPIFLVNT